jgi:hypothetical protein
MTCHSEQVHIIKEIGGVEYEFVYNSKGTLVKKCCASCRFKQPKDEDGPQRFCTHGAEPKITDKRDCCEYWSISSEINKMKTLCSISIKSDDKS